MRRTITLVVFCCHERICIHAYCVAYYIEEKRGLDREGENESLSPPVHFAVSLEGEGGRRGQRSLLDRLSEISKSAFRPCALPSPRTCHGCYSWMCILHYFPSLSARGYSLHRQQYRYVEMFLLSVLITVTLCRRYGSVRMFSVMKQQLSFSVSSTYTFIEMNEFSE